VLQNGRYYPTAMLTHRLQRTQGREVMLVCATGNMGNTLDRAHG
jgi:hypothetical protein